MKAAPAALTMAALSVMILTGCAQTHWVHATAPVERLGQDKSYCKRKAGREAEREHIKEQRIDGTDITGSKSTYSAQMAAYSTRKYETRIFDRCMQAKGYTKAKTAPSKP